MNQKINIIFTFQIIWQDIIIIFYQYIIKITFNLYENDKGDIVEDYVINTPLYKFYCGSADIINDYEIKRDIWETKEETLERVRTRRNNDVYVNERNLVQIPQRIRCNIILFNRFNIWNS